MKSNVRKKRMKKKLNKTEKKNNKNKMNGIEKKQLYE